MSNETENTEFTEATTSADDTTDTNTTNTNTAPEAKEAPTTIVEYIQSLITKDKEDAFYTIAKELIVQSDRRGADLTEQLQKHHERRAELIEIVNSGNIKRMTEYCCAFNFNLAKTDEMKKALVVLTGERI